MVLWWIEVAYCSLFDVRRSLFVVRCPLSVVCCSLFVLRNCSVLLLCAVETFFVAGCAVDDVFVVASKGLAVLRVVLVRKGLSVVDDGSIRASATVTASKLRSSRWTTRCGSS